MASEQKSKATLEKIVSLCKRRGFVYQAADIYGGLNGVYDFGHLGTLLKQNLRTAWLDSLSNAPGDMVFLEGGKLENDKRNFENEADIFAADTLLPPDDYNEFINGKSFYSIDIELFARNQNIDQGIVVGRLQHDGIIENSWHNKLRTRYEWSNEHTYTSHNPT